MHDNSHVLLCDTKVRIGEKYNDMISDLHEHITQSSELDQNGNAFATIDGVDMYGIKGSATLFFHNGLLESIQIRPDWSRYDLTGNNGQRIHIDEAVYRVYRECQRFLIENYGDKINDEYVPEVYRLNNDIVAALHMSPSRDSVSLSLRNEL